MCTRDSIGVSGSGGFMYEIDLKNETESQGREFVLWRHLVD
jgi:hypothetical protein